MACGFGFFSTMCHIHVCLYGYSVNDPGTVESYGENGNEELTLYVM